MTFDEWIERHRAVCLGTLVCPVCGRTGIAHATEDGVAMVKHVGDPEVDDVCLTFAQNCRRALRAS